MFISVVIFCTQAAAAGMAMPAMSAMNTSQIATGAMPLQPAALAAQPVSL